jgi:hypothetical protein
MSALAGLRPGPVALVGCVKSKVEGVHPARDLYVSPLFRKRRAYVEARGLAWFILSAEHGLVSPEATLHSYSRSLATMPAGERRVWGSAVISALEDALGELGQLSFEIHAGASYVEPVRPYLLNLGALVDVPTEGLGIGQQLSWYSARLVGLAADATAPPMHLSASSSTRQ